MNSNQIDGNLLITLITNGTINLRNDHQRINELNVFPVPDGDTGSNMQSTMMSGVKSIREFEDATVEKIGKSLARGLLMGARGNSGVILSQLFSGFSKEFDGLETATPKQFIAGLKQGVKQAYGAVINPVEGTILTVAREAADAAEQFAKDDTSLLEILKVYLTEAYASLKRTPDLLAVLKDAGVVDSGGAGFIVVIEGMKAALEGKLFEDKVFETVSSVTSHLDSFEGEGDFGYCTEFIVQLDKNEEFDKEKFIKRVSLFGDSLVVVSDEEICKVHIHTKNPGDVLNFGQQYGEFATLKIENMSLQHTETLLHNAVEGHDCGHDHGVYSSKKEKYGIITVVNGDGLKDMFVEMGVTCVINGGQTMNPSTEDFIKAVDSINAEHVLIIPNNGNVLLSAQTAAKFIENRDVTVLPAKTISQGYASLTMFDSNQEKESNIREMTELIENVKSGEVTYAVRDTEVNGVKIKKDEFIGIANGDIITSNVQRKDTVTKLFDKLIDEDSEIITIMYGEDVSSEELGAVMLYLEEHYSELEVEQIHGKQKIYSYVIAVE